jgi:hypothetical protein
MLSKSKLAARTILGFLVLSCSAPWSGQTTDEVNLVFVLEKNQLAVAATVAEQSGTFVIGSAQSRTVIDRGFLPVVRDRVRVVMGDRFSTEVMPVVEDLGGVVNGILGADAWRDTTLTVDYSKQLLTLSRQPAVSMDGRLHRFSGAPALPVLIDGQRQEAIIDLALPDTMTLPSQGPDRSARTKVRVNLAGYDMGVVDASVSDSTAIRVGNRLLSKFLVTIDYRRGTVALWRDPRTP